MRELKVAEDTIEKCRLPDNCSLVLLAQTSFSWDPKMRGSGIKVNKALVEVI